MPTPNSVSPAIAHRRVRPAAARMPGGASSMLRLARSGEARLPSGAALSDWAERAATMLDLSDFGGPRGREWQA